MTSLPVLLAAAASLGLVHTLVGPDHYLPFIVLGRAEGWSLRKTLSWTVGCGVAHVLSSVLLGAVGIALGWAVAGMEGVEASRGSLASWGLVAFGLAYLLWGLWRAKRSDHVHVHRHADGTLHRHGHDHAGRTDGEAAATTTANSAAHEAAAHEEPDHVRAHRRTAWTLFVIFVLGPCEPLIPLLMVPAAQHSTWGVALVAAVFGAVTIGTMTLVVAFGHHGLQMVRLRALERYVHAMAGGTLFIAGLTTQLFGL